MYTDLNFVMVNVQGLSGKCGNKLETDELREIFKNNDVVLFTETWGNDYTKLDVRDFTHVALNKTEIKANSKRASGGISIYIKDSLIKYGKDIELVAKRFDDDIIWLHLSTEYFNIINDYHLCLCYNVPAGSTRQVMVGTNIFDRLTEHIVKLKSISDEDCKFLVCGDFNARTDDLQDYVSDDDSRHIYPLPEDYTADEQLPRNNTDTVVNSNGRYLLDFCKGTGLRIANGRVGQDANIGECTYVGRNGSKLIDYILVSQNMLDMFSSFRVCTPNIFSDLCEIKFSLSEIIAPDELQENILKFEDPNVGNKYIWNKTLQDEYVTKLAAPETVESFENVFIDINDGTSNNEIDECVNNFVSV